MKLSKRRQISVALLVLGLVALVVDRAVLEAGSTGPAAAAASTTDTGDKGSECEDILAELEASVPMLEEACMADRLAELAASYPPDGEAVRDAFCPSESWVRPDRPVKAAAAPVAPRSMAARFVATHQLKAIMLSSDGGSAIIGASFVRVGQTVDGFKLLDLTKTTAVLSGYGERATLHLEGATAAAGGS